MKAVVQRVSEASVEVDGEVVGQVDAREVDGRATGALMVLLGVTHDDTPQVAERLAQKIWNLRILHGEMSASDLGAPLLVISQFTLYGDTRKGRRPSWTAAAAGPVAEPLYEHFCAALTAAGATVARGVFGADMRVSLVNDGPVTVIVEMGATSS